jgi:DNA-binding response OmpR family regulator
MGRDGKTIMLVDGSATLRYYYGILLKRLAFTVMVAESAEETLSIIKDSIPTLVLADRAILESGGADFVKKVKDCNAQEPVRVIVFADREDASARSTFLRMGCSDFLIKHQEPGRLYQSIQTVLEPKPREYIRLNIPLKVTLGDGTVQGGVERTEYVTNISEGGLYVRTLYPRPKSATTPVTLFIKDRAIRTKASVLYSQTLTGGFFREPGMGMKFIDISPDDRTFMRRFIREQLTSDLMIG